MGSESAKKSFQALKDHLEQNGDVVFKAPSVADAEALASLCSTIARQNVIYQPEELEDLAKAKLPEIIHNFYSMLYSDTRIDLGADINLITVDHIIAENAERAPGAVLVKFGYLTFAVTTGGNAICLDLNSGNAQDPRVLLADHAVFSGKEVFVYTSEGMVNTPISKEIIEENTVEISETFTGFIDMLANDELEDVEDLLE